MVVAVVAVGAGKDGVLIVLLAVVVVLVVVVGSV